MKLNSLGWLLLVLAIAGVGWKLARRFWPDSSDPPTVPLTLETKPRGAEVWFDGFPLGKTTPVTLNVDNALPHQLELRLAGWTRVRRTIPSGQPRGTLAYDLSEVGKVDVTSDPPGASVSVEGEEAGTTPCVIEVVPALPQRLTVALDGFLPASTSVTVVSRGLLQWAAHLRPAGILEISSDPSDVGVVIDGVASGRTPLRLPVEAGLSHQVQIALGTLHATASVRVQAGGVERVALRLEDLEDKKTLAAVRSVESRIALLHRRIGALAEEQPSQLRAALAETRRRELLEEEVDRLEQRQQELEGSLAAHRTELEERAASAASK